MIWTSPPYWGLRDYGTAQWEGGDSGCDHSPPKSTAGGESDKQNSNVGSWGTRQYGQICGKCGAKRIDSQLGLEITPGDYVDKIVLLFRELRRVLRDDGTVFLNLGDSYNGSGGAGGDYGPGGLKEGQPRYPGRNVGNLKPKDLVGIPWRTAFALQEDGWWLRSDIIWAKGVSFNPVYSGSSMPESVTDRPSKAHEYLFLLTKSQHYFYDNEAVKEPAKEESAARYNSAFGGDKNKQLLESDQVHTRPIGMREFDGKRNLRSVWTINPKPYRGSHFAVAPPALIEPCILAGTSEVGNCPECGNPWIRITERVGGTPTTKQERENAGILRHHENGGVYNTSNPQRPPSGNPSQSITVGWQPTCTCNKGAVPAVVLDPFAGSGTTLAVALQHGRHAVGFELNPSYIELAEERIAKALTEVTVEIPPLDKQLADLPLFSDEKGK